MKKGKAFAIKSASLVAALFLVGCSGTGQSAQSTASDTSGHPAPAKASLSLASPGSQFVEDKKAESLTEMKKVGTCSLESVVSVSDGLQHPGDVANSYKVYKGVSYTLIGFATDKDTGRVPDDIKVVLSGSKTFVRDAKTGRSRPDVAKYFNVPAFSDAGYQVEASFGRMPLGTYAVFILDAGTSTVCPTHQTLTVD